MKKPTAPDALLSAKRITELLDCSVNFWMNEVNRGAAPKPVVARKRFHRWSQAEVMAYVDRLKQGLVPPPRAVSALGEKGGA